MLHETATGGIGNLTRMRLTRFFLVNVVVVFVLLEIVLRLQEPYFHLMAKGNFESPNNLIMTQYHPVWNQQTRGRLQELELSMWIGDDQINYTVTTNSWGCRYPEIVIPKPAMTYRVIVIGDSFTVGYKLQDTVAVKLEQELKRDNSGLRYEILNCASSTYSPLPMYLRLRDHLMQIEPDAIIVNVDQTDMYDDSLRYRPRMVVNDRGEVLSVRKASWQMIELTKVAMEWSAAVRTLVSTGQRIAMKLGFYGSTTEIPASTDGNVYWFHTVQPADGTPRWQEAFEFLAGNVKRIIDLCADRGVDCAFTTYPHVGQIGGPGLQPKQHREFSLRLRKVIENKNTFFYDAYEDIAAAQNSGMNLFVLGGMRFNQEGQRNWSAAFGKHLAPWLPKKIFQRSL